jgi:hypothetical protein
MKEILDNMPFDVVELSGPGSVINKIRDINKRERMVITGIASVGDVFAEDELVNQGLDSEGTVAPQDFSLNESTIEQLQKFLLAYPVSTAQAVGGSFVNGRLNDITIRSLQELLLELQLPVTERKGQSFVTGSLDLPTLEALNVLLLAERAPPTISDLLEKSRSAKATESGLALVAPAETKYAPLEQKAAEIGKEAGPGLPLDQNRRTVVPRHQGRSTYLHRAQNPQISLTAKAADDEEFRRKLAVDDNLRAYVDSRMRQQRAKDDEPARQAPAKATESVGTGTEFSVVEQAKLDDFSAQRKQALLRKLENLATAG